MFSNNIDSAWGTSNEVGFGWILGLEFLCEGWVSLVGGWWVIVWQTWRDYSLDHIYNIFMREIKYFYVKKFLKS